MTTPIKTQLSASYVPGRDGDLDLPEVISPLPQRTLPKLPSNMQEGLARLELETNQSQNSNIPSTGIPLKSPNLEQTHVRHSSLSKAFWTGFQYTNQAIYQSIIDKYRQPLVTGPITFNPFPRTQTLGPSVPLSAEEKGELLEKMRQQILKSMDPEIQLAWAQDALLWVDIENEYATRMISENQPIRSVTPKLERQIREDAVNIVKHLGEQGHPKAEFIKAYWAELGKFGYAMDKKESFLCYTRAADKGFVRAHYRIGMQYENSGNPIKAMEHYRRGVSLHDSASHYRLGMMTLLGQHGIPVDCCCAVSLLRFAAETADENSPQGAYVYGMLLARELPNISVPEQYLPYNIREARKNIEKAAYLGFSKAQVKMGLAYELCQFDCEFDPALSLHYNALASRQGEAAADMAISKWFLCGYEDLFDKNEKLAFLHAQRAAATELPMAEFAMGYFYEIGMYVTCDLHESERWYKKAAEHGNVDALERITNIKANNVFSLKDHEQIAVNRIKSRYGSQRGERPDRFRKPPLSLPTVKREQKNTQSVINPYGAPIPIREDVKDAQKSYVDCNIRPEIGDQRNSYPGTIPAKVTNTNNLAASPLSPPSISTNRPISIAPYPVDDTDSITYAEDSHRGSHRPQSAFGIRPTLIHPKTEANFRENSPRPTSELRPSSSLSIASTHGGQSESTGNRLISPRRENQQPEFRTSALHNQGLQNRLHNYVPNRPGPHRLQKPASSPNMTSPNIISPTITSPNLNRIRTPHNSDDFHGRLPSNKHESPVTRRDPAVSYPLRPDRKSTSNLQQLPQNSNNQPRPKPQQILSSQQPPRPSKELKTKTRPLPSPPGSSSITASQPKKTGPATFEEMGIPAANKEGECVIMPPRKHKLEDGEETDSTSPSQKIKKEASKIMKVKTEKKPKTERVKKEKSDGKKIEINAFTKSGKEVKEKVSALHGDEAMELMLKYLKDQNRPYSATEISANLHGKVGKTVADKLLKEMGDIGKIKSKSTRGNEKGSQWIFWALQDDTDNIGPEELSQMDEEIKEMKENVKEMKIKLKANAKSLETLKNTPTTKKLIDNIENLRIENKSKKERLQEYRSGENKMVTREEMSKVDKELIYWTKKQLARKRAFQCLEDLMLETKTREELWEEAGIEEDVSFLK
ncbi:hypothetical protein EPUL_004259 [Erysiphe pulchra]|uniref:Homologous-pairing protein 2 winged helix domain-containing protein n=1 Tax=Erysiphe pulchra TaxID=225359 RepID=A0A2S4PPG2_9PEZI|nr:hypothetical protein EPUL_004259 [Erysiphe pulchra]